MAHIGDALTVGLPSFLAKKALLKRDLQKLRQNQKTLSSLIVCQKQVGNSWPQTSIQDCNNYRKTKDNNLQTDVVFQTMWTKIVLSLCLYC